MALTGLTNLQPNNIKVTGIATFDQTVGIAGTLTYEDVTNIDAVGLITARSGVSVSGGQVSVGAGTSLHSTGLDLGTGNITGHNLKSTGIITATSFVGSGANLTGITQTTINNNAANKVIMGSNTANTLEAVAKSTLFGNLSHGQNFLDDNNLIFGDASDMILIHQASGAKSRIRNTNDSGSLDIESTLTRFTNKDGSSEKLRIDSSGRILKGLTSARGNYGNNTSGVEHIFQIEGTSAINATLAIVRNSNDANDGGIVLGKTRATSNGGNTVVQAGDDLGNLTFAGNDGSTMLFGAEIFAEVQSGVGNDDMPADLIFKTNGGSTSTTERLRIGSSGFVGIDEDDPQTKLDVRGTISSGRNVAREVGTIINISNQYTAYRGGANVINGNKNYDAGPDWLTASNQRVNANLTIDLGTQYNCDRFVIYNQNEYQDSKREVKNFTLEGSNDNSSWTTILDDNCGASGAHEPNPGFSFRMPASYYDDDEGVSYRYWKFTMKSFHGSDTHGGVMELELYEHNTTIHKTSEIVTSSLVAGDTSAETLQGIKRLYASKGMNIYTSGLSDTWEITETGQTTNGSYIDKSTIRHKRGVVAVSSSYNSGDLFIRVDNLYPLSGNAWWVFGMFILSNEIQGGQGGGHHYVTSLQLMGLGSWNSVSTSNIVGSMSVSVNQSGNNYVELFVNVNDSSRGPCTVICNGGTFDPPRISFH
jgi:hypothetical protein